MSLKKVFPYAFLATMALTACGGDDKDDDGGTEPTGDTPTQAEVGAMMSALAAIGSVGGLFLGQGADAQGFAAQTQTYSETANCPNGGTTAVNGSYTIVSQTAFKYTVTQTYNNCKATGSGTIYTFNGQGLTLNVDYSFPSNGNYSYKFKETGNITWAGNGKGGTCPVDITINLSYSSTGYNYTTSGTYCGVNIST